MPANFNLYSQYYNLLYADKDYRAESDYIRKCLTTYHSGAKTILEFGSGTGRHGLELMESGYQVYGIERSESMVEQARAHGFPCESGDITNFSLGKKFDAVIALFHVISYLNRNDALIQCFRNAAFHLNTGGVFLFDVWYSPAVYHLGAVPRIKKISDETVSVIRFAQPVIHANENVIDVRYTVVVKDRATDDVSEFEESHPMRHFSSPEIGLLAESTGFAMIKSEEFLTGNEPGINTWGVCFILKKK